MKHRILIVTLLIVSLLGLTAHGEDLTIIESPHVKIVIDGMIGEYEDVPLIVNDRTMLPLRAVLTNLGIPNDDDHIIWNGEERSVTVISGDGTTTIWLQIDTYTAKVNGEALPLDVAPMIYAKNNRTYIPARFVSEALGKVVAWDGSTTAVLITDAERYDAIKNVLEMNAAAMENIENLSMDLTSSIATEGPDAFNMDLILSVIENPRQPASYIKLSMDLGMDIEEMMAEGSEPSENMAGLMMMMAFLNMEIYEMEDFTYSKSFLSGDGWLKSETEVSDETVTDTSSVAISQESMVLGTDDTILAGLILSENEEDGTIILEGTVFLEDMAEQTIAFNGTDSSKVDVLDYSVVYIIHKDTYETVSLQVDMTLTGPDEEGHISTISSSTIVNMDVLDEDYKIVVPEDVLNNIVELDFGF